ncbi:MAG: restriction endonuclease subunit S [Candidatus Pacearchaeota archaeon]|jgi:type I restriction enzyme S subunit
MKHQAKFKQTEIGEIPVDWEVKELREVLEQIFSGGTPNTRIKSYWGGDINWLSSGETNQVFIHNTKRKITQDGINNSSTRLARKGDVVIASAGQGNTRGQTSYCMVDTYINQSIISVRNDKKILNSLYLFYNLVSRYNELRNISDGNSSRGSLTTKLIAELKIMLPSLSEQQSISKILSSLDKKIELNQKMNKTLEEIGQELFKHWFVDFEFPNEKGKPYKSHGGEVIDSEMGDIPKGWKIQELENISKIIDCLHTKKPEQIEEGRLLLQVYNIGELATLNLNEKYYISEEDYIKWSKNIEVSEGDILLTNAGLTGAIIQIPYNFKGAIGRNLTSIRYENPYYLLAYLFSKHGQNQIQKNIDQGTIFSSLNVKGIKKIKILIPPSYIFKNFELIYKNFRKMIEKNNFESMNLKQLRDLLLPKLISGKIRVPLENDK